MARWDRQAVRRLSLRCSVGRPMQHARAEPQHDGGMTTGLAMSLSPRIPSGCFRTLCEGRCRDSAILRVSICFFLPVYLSFFWKWMITANLPKAPKLNVPSQC